MELIDIIAIVFFVVCFGVGLYLLLPARRVPQGWVYRIKPLIGEVKDKPADRFYFPLVSRVLARVNCRKTFEALPDFWIKTTDGLNVHVRLGVVVAVQSSFDRLTTSSHVDRDELLAIIVQEFKRESRQLKAYDLIQSSTQLLATIDQNLMQDFAQCGIKLYRSCLIALEFDSLGFETYVSALAARRASTDALVKVHETEEQRTQQLAAEQQLWEEIHRLEQRGVDEDTQLLASGSFHKLETMSGFACYYDRDLEHIDPREDTLTQVLNLSPDDVEDAGEVLDLVDITHLEKAKIQSRQSRPQPQDPA